MSISEEGLKSHPHLKLHEHIFQIQMVFQSMEQYHSSYIVDQDLRVLLKKIAILHDVGKSTFFFQEYIKDPDHYTGNRNDKRHTPLSTFLSILWLKNQQEDIGHLLRIAAVICGHHSCFPTLPLNQIESIDESPNAIDRFLSGDNRVLLKKQIKKIRFDLLEKETGIKFIQWFNPNDIDISISLVREIKDFLYDRLIPSVCKMNLSEAVSFRLKCQLAYSLFLEADKAFLAVTNPDIYLKNIEREWQSNWVEKLIGDIKSSETNDLRTKARREVLEFLLKIKGNIFTLTAPTGLGKTLLAATWALKIREQNKNCRKIIIILPFLSVIDQTVKVYKDLLKIGDIENVDGWLMTSHSLADRIYDSELPEKDNSFLVDTWRSDLIITTYDQFLLSLMEPNGKYQMRFHNLCDALIIMDEVQSLPCKLWQPLGEIFKQLTNMGNSKILLMSATLPPFLGNAEPLLKDPANNYFMHCRRYSLKLRINELTTLEDFCRELDKRLPEWFGQKKRILLTFNTRKCARKVRDYIVEWRKGKPECYTVPLYFISADVIPKHRLEFIKEIKKDNPCIVVSTQCIEAGVDIDMDLVIRDFGPLDSLIQLGGRCNREGLKPRGIVEIIDLIDDAAETAKKKRFSSYIYDETHLAVTRKILTDFGQDEIFEEDIFRLCQEFYSELSVEKDTGYVHLERFARWQEDIPVMELLRGKEKLEYTFLVISEDRELKKDMEKVSKIEDQWIRREGWRKLAGRIAMVSVSIFAKVGFRPESIAEEYKGHWILRNGYYSKDCGLMIEGEPLIF
jgi:CRISPR-associated endonuclease/helicase Cas3